MIFKNLIQYDKIEKAHMVCQIKENSNHKLNIVLVLENSKSFRTPEPKKVSEKFDKFEKIGGVSN